MTTLEILTVEKIRSWWPCKDPVTELEYIAEDWTGTIIDILDMDIEHGHKLWCIKKLGILSIRAWQEFAIFCGYQALSYIENPDPRSIAGLKAAELYLNGEITKEEIQTAALYARDASEATSPPSDAASFATAAATYNADYYAIQAAYDAVRAAYSAAPAANDSRTKQIAKLKELILETTK